MSVTTRMRFIDETSADAATEEYVPRRGLFAVDSPTPRRTFMEPREELAPTVAQAMARLLALDPRWAHVTSIRVGTYSPDIDDLVIGPGGVFTITAEDRGVTGPHLVRNSRFDAERAAKLLTAAARRDVPVRGVVVSKAPAELLAQPQSEVEVVDGFRLVDFLLGQPLVLDSYGVTLVLACARLKSTWR